MKAPNVLLSRTTILMAGLLAQGIARFLYTVVVGRLAGPETLGEVNAVLSLAVYLSLFWPAALGVAGSRYIPSLTHGKANAAGTLSYLKRSFWISTAIISPLGGIIAIWLTGDALTGGAAGVLIATYGGYTFVRGTMLGQDRVVRITVLDTVSSTVALTLLLLVVTLDASALLLLPLSVGYLAFSWIGWPRSRSSTLNDALRLQIRSFTAASVVWLVAAGGLLPSTMVFAQIFATPREAGIFAAAMTLATPANMIAQALAQVLVPYIAARTHAPEAIRVLSVRLFALTVGGFAVVFGALAALTPWLLTTFYGAQYVEGTTVMYGLLIGVFLSSCATVPTSVLMATGRQKTVSSISVVAIVLGTAAMAGLAPALGVHGVVIGFIGAWALAVIALTIRLVVANQSSRSRPAPPTD